VGVLVLSIVVGLLVGGKDGGKKSAPSRPATGRVRRPPLQPGSVLPTLPPRAQALLDNLSLERRVGQLFLVDFPGRQAPRALADSLKLHGWGGVLFTRDNYANPGQSNGLVGAVTRIGRRTKPVAPLVVADQDGGPATAFPFLPPRSQPRTAARVRVADGAAQARAAGRELHRRGISMTLAPQADLDVTSGAVSQETFSPRPKIVTSFVSAQLDAYRRTGVIAAIGHFPGQGSVSEDPDLRVGSVGLSLADLRSRDEVPFRSVAARAPAFVVSNALYAAFDGVTPAALLPEVVGELRGPVAFHGVIVSDDLGATVQATGEDVGAAAVRALKAGIDLVYVSGGPAEQERAYRAVLAAARSGQIAPARLKGALTRLLALKISARLLPNR
jgi:beta-N-acetylhexosaminidase